MKRLAIYTTALVAMWLGVVAFKAEIAQQFWSWTSHRANRVNGWSDNPLYPEMQKVAQKYGVDVSFIRQAGKARYVLPDSAEIFTKPPGYYDVIIFGDSSLVWSFAPQIVSQVSGKKVAFLGYEAALPNKAFAPFAQQICDVYLKRNGVALFLFAQWGWAAGPNDPQMNFATESLMDVGSGGLWGRSFERAADAVLALPRLALYSDAVEPYFAPEVYRKKHKGEDNYGCTFYSWGVRAQALFMHCAADNGAAQPALATQAYLPGAIVKSCDGVADAGIATNLAGVADTTIRNKVIVVPLSDIPMPRLACEARRLKDRVKVMDLPALAVERYDVTTLELQRFGTPHLANTASIASSYVMGRALKELRWTTP